MEPYYFVVKTSSVTLVSSCKISKSSILGFFQNSAFDRGTAVAGKQYKVCVSYYYSIVARRKLQFDNFACLLLCIENEAETSSILARPKTTSITTRNDHHRNEHHRDSQQPVPRSKEPPLQSLTQPVTGTKLVPAAKELQSQLVPRTNEPPSSQLVPSKAREEVKELRETLNQLRRQSERQIKQLQEELAEESIARQQLLSDFEQLKKLVTAKLRTF